MRNLSWGKGSRSPCMAWARASRVSVSSETIRRCEQPSIWSGAHPLLVVVEGREFSMTTGREYCMTADTATQRQPSRLAVPAAVARLSTAFRRSDLRCPSSSSTFASTSAWSHSCSLFRNHVSRRSHVGLDSRVDGVLCFCMAASSSRCPGFSPAGS